MLFWHRRLLSAVALAAVTVQCVRCAAAQPAIAQSQKFDLSDIVQLDQADHGVLVQFERVKACVAERQWNDAVDILSRLAETSEGKLIQVHDHRYISLCAYCQMQLAALPAEALAVYRSRVDPAAQRWCDDGIAQRDSSLLWKVVDQAFASSCADKALMALAEFSLEAGDFAAARWCWERILPHKLPAGAAWPGYPDSKLDAAAIRARLVLVSILEGNLARARVELAQYASLHPDARGRWAGQEVKFAEALGAMLTESTSWPALPSAPGWPTFAGNASRNKIASPLIDVGTPAWRVSLQNPLAASSEPGVSLPFCFEPIVVGGTALVNDHRSIRAFQLDRGGPAWGKNATIYDSQRPDAATSATLPNAIGVPRFTMTALGGRLFARMGNAVTSEPQGGSSDSAASHLVCLDLTAEGRLLWRVDSEKGWAFEGSPIADAQGVYVAMRRNDIRPQLFVACLDPETGKLRWRRFVCAAETLGHGVLPDCSHNLLTLAGSTIYCNTNLGAVAAIRTGDGHLLWVSVYRRERSVDLGHLAPYWRRELNPCVYDQGTLLVAPAGTPRVFAFDAATGQMLWHTGEETSDVLHLLGTTGDCLVAGGRKLFWIGLNDSDRGRVKHVWPDGADRLGHGRGLLAGNSVLWPTPGKLYVFDQKTAKPTKVIDMAMRDVEGGNLVVSEGRLLVAATDELVVLDAMGGTAPKPREIAQHLIPSEEVAQSGGGGGR